MGTETRWDERRKRISAIIEVGNDDDFVSRSYDVINTLCIVANLTASILDTFDYMELHFGAFLTGVEILTYLFFAVDYVLRLWTAKYLYPKISEPRAILRYAFSLMGIVDLLSFLPYYLPFFFPAGAVTFRMFRVVRIFRLFRINVYYDSLNVITEVLVSKRQQLLSSVFIILVLMVASSLCMYSLEHEAQPEVFQNAFSGIWWSVSTLLTVGYGDIYPITTLGKIFSIFITFLGVGMVAIPTGIISAGFVDQYSRVKRISEYGSMEDIHFIKVHIQAKDDWCGQCIRELGLPSGVIVAAIQRRGQVIVPRGEVKLLSGDTVVLGAESFMEDERIDLQEIILRRHHPWVGQYIRDLDISRRTLIVMVKRNGRSRIPNGDMILRENDRVVLYTQRKTKDTENIPW